VAVVLEMPMGRCNPCGLSFLLPGDLLSHIAEVHNDGRVAIDQAPAPVTFKTKKRSASNYVAGHNCKQLGRTHQWVLRGRRKYCVVCRMITDLARDDPLRLEGSGL
jgi:hypothetical protein